MSLGMLEKSWKRKEKILLIQVEREALISGLNCKIRELKSEVNFLLNKEARLWSQRSVFWLKNGDNNTKFFHNKATKRHRKNSIRGIFYESNSWQDQPNEIVGALLKYYHEFFSMAFPNSSNATLNFSPHVITEEMNNLLTGEFLECEVTTALKQMSPLKAPSTDEMPLICYQHFWQVVDIDVVRSILSWLNSGTLPHHINHTFITFIPKIKNSEFVHEYRPISLCNVLYKIFSKVLANRLNKVLPNIITEHQ